MREIDMIQPQQVTVSVWSGGTTSQLGIGEGDCSYAGRDFLWRLSSATVDDEVSTFTPLPDYHRLILMQEGTVVLEHDGKPGIVLAPWQVHSFDGGVRTVCTGRATDFNLMLRKGKAEGSLTVLEPAGSNTGAAPVQGCGADERDSDLTLELGGTGPGEKKRIYGIYNGGADLEIDTEGQKFRVCAGGILFLSVTEPEGWKLNIREVCRKNTTARTILPEIRIRNN